MIKNSKYKKNKDEERSNTPFDALFKNAMENLDVARDVIKTIVPKEILALINLNNLILCPQSFIDNKLTYRHVDLLYRTEINEQNGYIYILKEAQKEPDPDLPLRMMQYILRIIEHHRKQFETKDFPIVYPVIYYIGQKTYRYSTDFFDGFGDNKELAKSILTKAFKIENVVVQNVDDLKKHPLAGTLAGIFSLAYSRDVINDLKKLSAGFNYIEHHYGSDLIISMLEFTLAKVEKGNVDDIIETINKIVTEQTRGEVMTLAQQLEQRGMQQGMHIRSFEIAKKLLLKKVPFDMIAETTDLSVEEIKKILKEMDLTKH